MSSEESQNYVPPWGREGWPEVPDGSFLDEDDRECLRQQLAMSPLERLREMEEFVNDLHGNDPQPAKRGPRVPAD